MGRDYFNNYKDVVKHVAGSNELRHLGALFNDDCLSRQEEAKKIREEKKLRKEELQNEAKKRRREGTSYLISKPHDPRVGDNYKVNTLPVPGAQTVLDPKRRQMHKSWCPTLAYADPSVPAQAVNDLLDFVDGVKDIEGALEITKSFNYNADSVKALLQCSDPLSESWCSFEQSEFASAIQTNQGNLEAVAIFLQKDVKSCAWYFYHKFRPAQRRKDTTLTHYHDEFCYICYGEDSVIECCDCPKAYHSECHDNPKRCTSCESRSEKMDNKGFESELKSAPLDISLVGKLANAADAHGGPELIKSKI